MTSGNRLPPHLNPRGTGRSPATAGRDSIRSWRWAKVLASVVSACVLLTTGVAYGFYKHFDSQITRLHDILPGGGKEATNGAENILLVGSDSRTGSNDVFQAGPGQTLVEGQRSDTVILAHLAPGNAKAILVSLPRDSWVTIPAYTDAKGVAHPAQQNKLNAAYSLGGPKLLIATVQQLSGLHVDHYAEIDFEGFQKMVNALGGINVCLTQPAKDTMSGANFPAGENHLNGVQALAFVRQRYNLPNGDLDRVKRQQQFIGAVVRKVVSAGTLLNPVKLTNFLDAVTSSVSVDSGLDIKSLALRLRNLDANHVEFATLPFEKFATINGQAVNIINADQTAELFASLNEGNGVPTDTQPSAPAGSTITVPPKDVSVAVYNGAGINGLGKRVSSELTKVGFVISGTPGNRNTGAKKTEIHYAPSKINAANTLAASVTGAILVPDSKLGDTLELVVGSSYTTAKAVQMGAPVPATTAASTVPGSTTANEATCTR